MRDTKHVTPGQVGLILVALIMASFCGIGAAELLEVPNGLPWWRLALANVLIVTYYGLLQKVCQWLSYR
jgi:hypothetical protein